jgi:hypothetical protein
VSANLRYAYGGLSPGAEILAAEAALAAGVELHLVLPLPVEDYIAAFIDSAEDPDRWKERFWACLNRSASLVSLVDHAIPASAHAASRAEALRFAGGLALLRADALTSSAVMIDAGGGGGPAAVWSKAGRELVSLAGDTAGARKKTLDRGSDAFAAVVLLWPLDGGADTDELVRIAESTARAKLEAVDRQSRDRRRGTALRMPSLSVALDVVVALAAHCRDMRLQVRIIADYGLVLDGRGRFGASQVARLSGASDLLGFPVEAPLATVAFAAQARFSEARQLAFVPISRLSSGAAEARPLAAREVYAVAFGAGTPGYSFSVAAIQS